MKHLQIFTGIIGMCALSCAAATVNRVFHPERYSRGDTNIRVLQDIDQAAWIWHPDVTKSASDNFTPFLRFRKEFSAIEGEKLRFDVSADERYVLLLDGKAVSRGPHRGLPKHWFYQSYEVSGLEPGNHVFEAVVWQLGPHGPLAQLSDPTQHGGFIFKASGKYDAELSTGKAKWTVAILKNTRMAGKGHSRTFGAGDQCDITGTSFITELPDAAEYKPAVNVRNPVRRTGYGLLTKGWALFPTPLPDQMYSQKTPGTFRAGRPSFGEGSKYLADDAKFAAVSDFNLLLHGKPVTVPANTSLKMVWDLEDYYCAYPELTVSGGKGSEIRWGWTESLRGDKDQKGNRNTFENKAFSCGMVDYFRPDGRDEAFFTAPWWRCGRWCQFEVKTGDAPLTIKSLKIGESRYPTPPTASFECDDPTLAAVQKICVRGMQMCMHEMFFDCPYYEQQMYPGDSRVQYLTVGALNNDDRLIRQAISLYDYDRRDNGMISMNFPTRGTQESATYTMCWLLMFRDYMMWHNNRDWLRERLPGMRNTLSGLELYENGQGLLQDLPGWSFMDWVPNWPLGMAPNGDVGQGVSALNNLMYVYALQSGAATEAAFGNDHLAAHWRSKAEQVGRAVVAAFWDNGRGMIADTTKKDRFSEHGQCLALLCEILDPAQRDAAFKNLVEAKDLARTTVYFSHYLFDTYIKFGRSDLFLNRLDLWRDYVKMGLKTPLESPGDNARSDCHAWGSHPLFHLHSGVLGIRPAEPFFRSVTFAPQPAGLKHIKAATPHPNGEIKSDLFFDGDRVKGTVEFPENLTGTFLWKGKQLKLVPGKQEINL